MADEFDQYKVAPANDDEFAQYKAAPDTTPALVPGLRAGTNPQDVGGRLTKWAQNVQEDIQNGTDLTGVGTLLKKMGAHGVYNGNSKLVGDLMASFPLGLAKVAEGAGQVMGGSEGGGMMEGAGKMLEGGAQASTFVQPFGGGEAAAQIPGIVSKGVSKGISKIPMPIMADMGRAGKALGGIEDVIGHIPIPVNEPGWKALEIKKLSQEGDSAPPKPVRDFITRIMDPNQPPLTFKEARSFYSNSVRKLTPEESTNLSDNMKRKLGDFAHSLDESLGITANNHGFGQQYEEAMKEYRLASRREKFRGTAIDLAKQHALKVALGASGLYAYEKLAK